MSILNVIFIAAVVGWAISIHVQIRGIQNHLLSLHPFFDKMVDHLYEASGNDPDKLNADLDAGVPIEVIKSRNRAGYYEL